MRNRHISFLFAFVILFSGCVTPKYKMHGYRSDYFKLIEDQEKIPVPITISNYSSGNLLRHSHDPIVTVGTLSLWGLSIAGMSNLFVSPSVLLITTLFPYPFFFVFALHHLMAYENKRIQTYRQELDQNCLAAIEHVFENDSCFLLVPPSEVENFNNVINIDIFAFYEFIFTRPAQKYTPMIFVFWEISKGNGEKKHITTTNRFFKGEKYFVRPRKSEFNDAYLTLARQSAYSFLNLAQGEIDISVPTSPNAYYLKTEANITTTEYLSFNPFSAIQKFSARIDKGKDAGYKMHVSYNLVENTAGDSPSIALIERRKVIGTITLNRVEDDWAEGVMSFSIGKGQLYPREATFSGILVTQMKPDARYHW